MSEIKNMLFVLILIASFSFIPVSGQNGPAFEMNQKLGRGINIGNTFEAPSETEWSNPWNFEYAGIIAGLGFNHIRVPIRWEPRSLEEPPYTIDASFFERIESVIDIALEHGLHVIINMHHHDQLLNDILGHKDRFLSQWEQIAAHFSHYPDSLLFEVFNEPHGDFTPEIWNEYFPEALERIRSTNPDRMVLLGTAEWGGIGGLRHLEIPDDPNIILTVHYYSPFQFTHQGASWSSGADAWLGTRWYGTEAERKAMENDFSTVLEFSQLHNIPVHVGEFGAYSRADMDSRVRWTTFISRYMEQQGFSWAYWEFSAGFGIYNPSNGQLRQGLVDALLHNPIGEPTETLADTIYSSDFSTGNDGWSLNAGGGEEPRATMTRESGTLMIDISDPGSNAWDIQLIKPGMTLEMDKTYRVTLTVSTPQGRGITAYAGRDGIPWNAYSGYHNMTVSGQEQTYVYTFRMNDDTDSNTRLVFDLGGDATGFILYEFVLEETTIVIPYNLTINSVNGSVTTQPETDEYMGGKTFTLTAVPDEGFIFLGWSGDASGDANPIEVYINDDKNITAEFSALYTLTLSAENGTATAAPDQEEYVEGTAVTLSAVPSEGFEFSGWSGDAAGDANPMEITMDGNKNITASFSKIPVTWELTVTAENGSVTVDVEKVEYQDGETVVLTAVPESGFLFTGWSGDVDGDTNPLEIIMDSDLTITAHFDVDTGTDVTEGAITGIRIHPNPLRSGSLSVTIPAPSDVLILRVTGQPIMRFEQVTGLEIERYLFEPGIYIIRITGEKTSESVALVVD